LWPGSSSTATTMVSAETNLEGAVHGFTPCTACDTTRGQYSNSVKNLFDYIRDWTNKRF
jgi:hypothetical protein